MALPKTLVATLSPDELTFLAEEEKIQIVPSVSMTKVRLLSVSPRLPCLLYPGGQAGSGKLWK